MRWIEDYRCVWMQNVNSVMGLDMYVVRGLNPQRRRSGMRVGSCSCARDRDEDRLICETIDGSSAIGELGVVLSTRLEEGLKYGIRILEVVVDDIDEVR